ncbi:FAD-dependent monooxygenase, partial [Lichenihabitans sp. Uapishka_5]|uniref:FAD-dependent monooxygenase n=1 Tax=Lichenihabitans sp. Uapishka_5 TaxID=3037302 RepID=UPI0029E7D1C8
RAALLDAVAATPIGDLLPLRAPDGTDTRLSIVWTERTAEAERLAALPEAEFIAALEARIGPALGPMRLEDKPRALPLRLELARRLTGNRVALLGDAARVIHPLAGQGLNLGLRDAAALSEAVADAMELGLDPGAPDVLNRYSRARSFDAATMAAMTDGLNRLFSNDLLPLRALRDIGLGLVDRAPGAKRLFIGGATGVRAAS